MQSHTMQSPTCDQQLRQLLDKYDLFGPRYTSYPTALHFNSSFSDQDYHRHVEESNQFLLPKPLSLYVHIPFCHSLCYYCGCNKVVTHKPDAATSYLEALYDEIKLKGQDFAHDRLLQQIHFGGGTPTYLNNAQLREILEVTAQSFHLGLPDELEIGIEIDPRSMSRERFQGLLDIGINRISIGVQDFDPEVQTAINRIQSEQSVNDLLQLSRDQGIHSVSFDLIYGLPKQSKASLMETIDKVVEMRPDRIALYNYAHMPQTIASQRLILSEHLPTPRDKIDMFVASVKRLCAAGYVYIGMDHFALPTDSLAIALEQHQLQRNFQGYSTHADCDIIGVGVSAISRINNSYCQNEVKLSDYKARLAKEELPLSKGISLSTDDRLRASVIQQLMCTGEIIFADFETEFGLSFHQYFARELEMLEQLAEDNLLELDAEHCIVTNQGRLFLRNIAMVFDAYIQRSANDETDLKPRYSRTV